MNREKLAEMYTEHDLDKDDVFSLNVGGRSIPLIKREGVEKIQAKRSIVVSFDIVSVSDDNKYVVIKATGIMGDVTIETYGECSPDNSKQKYPIAMAEKRALSRAVLKLAGFYALGAYSEDEFEKE